MSRHVHFDLEAMRRTLSANSAATADAAMVQTRNDKDRAFVQTQRLLTHAVTELLVRCAEAENNGISERMIIRSAGLTIGKMAASLKETFGADILPELVEGFADGVNYAGSTGEDGVITGKSYFRAMPGGHA